MARKRHDANGQAAPGALPFRIEGQGGGDVRSLGSERVHRRPGPASQLGVPLDVIQVAVRGQDRRHVQTVTLDRLEQGTKRRAAVDDDGRATVPVRHEVGVRQPSGIQGSLEDHPAKSIP